MLTLSRHEYETVTITTPEGRVIKITVVEIRKSYKVRLGFDADQEVIIMRDDAKTQTRKE